MAKQTLLVQQIDKWDNRQAKTNLKMLKTLTGYWIGLDWMGHGIQLCDVMIWRILDFKPRANQIKKPLTVTKEAYVNINSFVTFWARCPFVSFLCVSNCVCVCGNPWPHVRVRAIRFLCFLFPLIVDLLSPQFQNYAKSFFIIPYSFVSPTVSFFCFGLPA